jgi:hypothetical protein
MRHRVTSVDFLVAFSHSLAQLPVLASAICGWTAGNAVQSPAIERQAKVSFGRRALRDRTARGATSLKNLPLDD